MSAVDLLKVAELLAGTRIRVCVSVAADIERFVRIAEIDAEMALVRARRALESMARTAATAQGITVADKSLEKVIADLTRSGNLPQIIQKHAAVVREFGNLAAHVLEPNSVQEPSIGADEVGYSLQSLELIATWFRDSVLPALGAEEALSVCRGEAVKWSHIVDATEIDKLVYPESYWTAPDVLAKWHARNADILNMVVDDRTGKAIGCLTAVPIEQDVFAKILAGTVHDLSLGPDSIREYDLPDFYALYLASVVVHPSYRGERVFNLMYAAFLDSLLDLARRDIYISEVAADAVSQDGERLCRFAGMQKVCASDHGSTMYRLIMVPPSWRVTTTHARVLHEYYRRKYEEFREFLPSIHSSFSDGDD